MPAVIHSLKKAQQAAAANRRASEPTPKVYAWLRSITTEPLFRFVVLGILTWAVAQYWTAQNNRYTIEIDPAERQRIAMTYQQQFGELPSPGQLKQLIDRRVREEIYLREGLALNLDKDDEIVRRRIVQKYEFLQTDLAAPADPAPTVLQQWFEKNSLRYLTPERVAFSQVYFSPDTHGDEAAKLRALGVLEKLRATRVSRAPDLGDPFPGPADVAALTPEEATRLLGDYDLSHVLFKLPVGEWQGPFRSGYGWHLIRVTGHEAPVLPPLSEIHDRVLTDYLEEQRQLSSERAYQKLRARYTVRYGTAR